METLYIYNTSENYWSRDQFTQEKMVFVLKQRRRNSFFFFLQAIKEKKNVKTVSQIFLHFHPPQSRVSQDTASVLHHSIETLVQNWRKITWFCKTQLQVQTNPFSLLPFFSGEEEEFNRYVWEPRSRLLVLHKIQDTNRTHWLCQCLFGGSLNNKQDETSLLTHVRQIRGNVNCCTVMQSPLKRYSMTDYWILINSRQLHGQSLDF